jgi:protein-L-isoaspartate O-methyltransferase
MRTVRSFFGVHRIWESSDGRFRLLAHGTTLHGAQRIRDDRGEPLIGRPDPITYYHQFSGMARVIDVAHTHASPIRYAVIGLGTGSLACYARPGDSVHYYEIDPAIVRIAANPSNFNFISECGPVSLALGDARLTLADAEDESYDAIIVDAFNSDAIPTHLLTREAMAIYRKKLAPHGIVAVHVSNRYLELAPVVAGIASANGMVARLNTGGGAIARVDSAGPDYIIAPTVVAAARADGDFGPLARSPYWRLLKNDPRQRIWTDDYSNVIGALVRKLEQ